MIDPSIFFYLTLAAAVFYVASAATGHRVRHAKGARGRRGARSGWSLNSAVLFVAGVGIGGFFSSIAGLATLVVLATAGATGAALAAGEIAVLGALVRRQHSSATNAGDLVGAVGTVEISIAREGTGRIRCERDGETFRLLARSRTGAIELAARVRVVAVDGSIATVERETDAPLAGWRS
jgi:membrane protein implicated in regulation of membrane protease activity